MGDPVFDFLDSGGKTAPAPARAPSASPPSTGDPVYEFLNSGGKSLPPVQEKPMEAPVIKAVKDYSPDNTTALEVAGHVASGVAGSVYGGWKGLASLASGGTLEDAANAVHEGAEQITYQPRGEEAQKVIGQIAPVLNAIPKAAGAVGELTSRAGNYIADSISDFAPETSATIRSATPAAATAVEVAGNMLAPGAALKAAKVPLRLVKPEGPPAIEARVEPTLEQQASSAQAKVKAATDWEAAQRDLNEALKNPQIPKQTIDQLQTRASVAEDAYKKSNIELEPPQPARARVTPDDRLPAESGVAPEPATFLDAAPEAGPLGSVEATQRARTLQRVGIDQVRKSAISGDAKAASTDYQTSKLDSPAGKHMSAVLDSEKAALQNYSEGLINDTGGTAGTDTATLYSRGNTILAPLDELNNYFNKQISALYKEADSRARGSTVSLPKTHEFVGGDQAEFLGTTEGEALLKGLRARMKSLGMLDAEGNPQPVTIQQAEQLKQYLNNQWQPRTSRLVSGMKNAIDDDVLATAGEDIYKKARAMRAMKSAVFENDLTDPQGRTIQNGVAKLFDANGKGLELKSGASTEKVADIVTTLPADQLGSLVRTLKNLPSELKAQGEAALSEIKAQFANKVHDIGSAQQGQWAARNVSKYLNQNAARLQQVFTRAELDKFNDLNDAGHILAKDQSYPGAAVQEHNLVEKGLMHGARSGGAALGGAIAGVPGAAVGGFVGNAAANKIGESASLKAAQKRTIRLSDFPGIDE